MELENTLKSKWSYHLIAVAPFQEKNQTSKLQNKKT